MELVAAAFEHHVELPAGVAPERGVVAAGGHLELAHGVHRRRHGDAVELGVAVENAVEQELIGILPGAVDVDREIAADRSRRALGGRDHAGQQQTQLVEIAPVQGQAGNLPVIHYAAERRRAGAQYVGHGGHLHRVFAQTGVKENLDGHVLVQQQLDFLDLRGVAVALGFDPIIARRQVGDGELAPRVGERLARTVGLLVDQMYGDSFERFPPGIGDRTADRLGGGRQGKE